MFPPKRTASVTKWLEDMLTSLRRGGLEFSWDILLEEPEEGLHDVKVRLLTPIPRDGWLNFRTYVQQYSFVAGWRVEKLRQAGRFLMFRASRALSSAA